MPFITPPWCDTFFMKEPTGLLLETLGRPARRLPLADAVAFGAAPWRSHGAVSHLSAGGLNAAMLEMTADSVEGVAIPSLEKLYFGVGGDSDRWPPGNASAGRFLYYRCGDSGHPQEGVRAILDDPERCRAPGGLGRIVRAGAMLQARVAATDRGALQPASDYKQLACPTLPQLQCLLFALNTATRRPYSDVDVFMTSSEADSSASIGWHVDELDVLLVQLRGRKRFRVAGVTPGSALRVDATLEPGDAVYVPAGFWHCGGDNAEQEHSILLSVALSLPEAARGDGAVAWREAARTSRETFLHMIRAFKGREEEVAQGDWAWAGSEAGAAALSEFNERFEAAAAALRAALPASTKSTAEPPAALATPSRYCWTADGVAGAARYSSYLSNPAVGDQVTDEQQATIEGSGVISFAGFLEAGGAVECQMPPSSTPAPPPPPPPEGECAAAAAAEGSPQEQPAANGTAPRHLTLPLDGDGAVLVVDNFLPAAEAEAFEAAARSTPFASYAWFPGERAPVPPTLSSAIRAALVRLRSPLAEAFGATFGGAEEGAAVEAAEAEAPTAPAPLEVGQLELTQSSMLSAQCHPSPAALSPFNQLAFTRPHIDVTDLNLVLFLSSGWRADAAAPGANASSGGLAFYRERASGASRFRRADCDAMLKAAAQEREPGRVSAHCPRSLSALCERLESGEVGDLELRALVGRGALPPDASRREGLCFNTVHGRAAAKDRRRGGVRYMAASDHSYKLLQVAPYAFNRAVLFDAKQLHAAYLDEAAVAALSCEPTKRRLVASFFLRRKGSSA